MITSCCPLTSYLVSATTVLNPCPSDTGQIQKAIFWRSGNSLSVASALQAITWNTLISATDDTRAIITPFVHHFILPLGEAREHPDTRDGATLRKANKSTKVDKKFLAEDQDVVRNLKRLRCESLEVIFINEASQFVYDDREGDFRGFPVINNSLYVGDKRIGGFSEYDSNRMIFNLEPAWSDTAEISEQTTFGLTFGGQECINLCDFDANCYIDWNGYPTVGGDIKNLKVTWKQYNDAYSVAEQGILNFVQAVSPSNNHLMVRFIRQNIGGTFYKVFEINAKDGATNMYILEAMASSAFLNKVIDLELVIGDGTIVSFSIDGAVQASDDNGAYTPALTAEEIGRGPKANTKLMKLGTLYDFKFYNKDTLALLHRMDGHGITDAAWDDSVGGLDATFTTVTPPVVTREICAYD